MIIQQGCCIPEVLQWHANGLVPPGPEPHGPHGTSTTDGHPRCSALNKVRCQKLPELNAHKGDMGAYACRQHEPLALFCDPWVRASAVSDRSAHFAAHRSRFSCLHPAPCKRFNRNACLNGPGGAVRPSGHALVTHSTVGYSAKQSVWLHCRLLSKAMRLCSRLRSRRHLYSILPRGDWTPGPLPSPTPAL